MALINRNENERPAELKRADATRFMQELTGMPARSIGSQIAVLPPVPQPSSPLASVGQPPVSEMQLTSVADATTVVDVFTGADVGQAAIEDQLDIPDAIDPGFSFDDQSEASYESAPWAIYSGPLDTEVIAAGGSPTMSRRTDLSHEQKMEIAHRMSVGREHRQAIVSQQTKADQIREHRSHANDTIRLEPQPLQPEPVEEISAPQLLQPTATSPQPGDMRGPKGFYATPTTDGYAVHNDGSAGIPAGSHGTVRTDQITPENGWSPIIESPAADPSPTPNNQYASVPMVAEAIEQIRQEIMRSRQESRRNTAATSPIDVSPQPSMLNQQTPSMDYVEFEAEPNSRVKSPATDQQRQTVSMAEDFIDVHNDVIGMIIDCLSRLTTAYETHRARLSTILDRLDSEANVNEYGEGDSSWLG